MSPYIPEPSDRYSIIKSSKAASTKEPPEPASPSLNISSATNLNLTSEVKLI